MNGQQLPGSVMIWIYDQVGVGSVTAGFGKAGCVSRQRPVPRPFRKAG